jgi:tetratricopeptide (TPR) repeat protein
MSDPTPDAGSRDTPNLGTVAGNQAAEPNLLAATPASTLEGASPSATAPGAEVGGRYRLGDEIARGGMGVVYAAHDLVLDRDVGLKTLQQSPPDGGALVRRFREEARITAQLQHPAIPPVHDLGTLTDGSPFLAMKLIRGHTLAALLRDRPTPADDLPRFVAVFEQVCQAVGYAHAQGVIHRDLKPSNVMVGAFGEVQVMDWGLAKSADGRQETGGGEDADRGGARHLAADGADPTRAGAILGTPAYMPPEQARGEIDRVDARSDVFALGAILCEVVTGRRPYGAGPSDVILARAAGAVLTEAAAALDGCPADGELVALCRWCLAADAADRPADAGEVAGAVAAYRAGVEGRLRAAERQAAVAEARAAEQRKRQRLWVALAGAGVAIAGLVAVGAWWADHQAGVRKAESLRRQGEEQARADQNGQAIAFQLGRWREALGGENAALATAIMNDVRRRIDQPGGEPHRAEFDRRQADTAMLLDLERFWVRWWTSGGPQRDEALAACAEAFRRYGIVPGVTRPEEAAERIGSSPVRHRLLATMDHWLVWTRGGDLSLFLHAADPHPFRCAVRRAFLALDFVELANLAGDPAALDQPAWFVPLLGGHGHIPRDRREPILRRALETRPGDLGVLMTLSDLDPPNRREGAAARETWLRAALAVRPDNPAVWTNLGTALRDGGKSEAAIAYHREAIRLDRTLREAHVSLGAALADKGDHDGAIAAHREAIRLGLRIAAVYTNLGSSLNAKGDHDGAIAALREAIRLDPDYAAAHYGLGLALARTGDWAGAVAKYREVIRLNPNEAQFHYGLGEALFHTGDLLGSAAAYREAARLDPGLVTGTSSLSAGLGRLFQPKPPPAGTPTPKTGAGPPKPREDPDAVIRASREAIRLDPMNAVAHLDLGTALTQKGDWAGALPHFREAVRLDPTSARAQSNLGAALTTLGDKAAALPHHREAVRLAPAVPMVRYNLGFGLYEAGDLDGAIAEWREAARLDPKNDRFRRALDLALKSKAKRDERTAPPPREVSR